MGLPTCKLNDTTDTANIKKKKTIYGLDNGRNFRLICINAKSPFPVGKGDFFLQARNDLRYNHYEYLRSL